jgi:hypothetical protein
MPAFLTTFTIGTPHTHNAGYYRNDDTPAGGRLSEADVQTCKHCQRVIKMQEWKGSGGWCSKCQSPLCDDPVCAARTATYGCVPFLQRLEQFAESQVKFSQHLKIAGLAPPEPPRQLVLPG